LRELDPTGMKVSADTAAALQKALPQSAESVWKLMIGCLRFVW